MNIYHYHKETGVYIGMGSARQNPIRLENFLIPAYATVEEPPSTGEGEVAVWNDNEWTTKEDHRGIYWDTNGDRHVITEPGVVPEEGWTTNDPYESNTEEKI